MSPAIEIDGNKELASEKPSLSSGPHGSRIVRSVSPHENLMRTASPQSFAQASPGPAPLPAIVFDPPPECNPKDTPDCYEKTSDEPASSLLSMIEQLATLKGKGGKVKLYGRDTCGMCKWTRAELEKNNIAYEWKGQDREMYELIKKTGKSGSFGIPVCDVCGEVFIQPRDKAFFEKAEECVAPAPAPAPNSGANAPFAGTIAFLLLVAAMTSLA